MAKRKIFPNLLSREKARTVVARTYVYDTIDFIKIMQTELKSKYFATCSVCSAGLYKGDGKNTSFLEGLWFQLSRYLAIDSLTASPVYT